ncbi:MAG: hypothetical protein RLZZ532_2690 [Cyanobacteriota bacterium]
MDHGSQSITLRHNSVGNFIQIHPVKMNRISEKLCRKTPIKRSELSPTPLIYRSRS